MVQGCPARICMPITAAPIKVESVKRLGGIIELVGETYAEAQTYAQVQLIIRRHSKTQHATQYTQCADRQSQLMHGWLMRLQICPSLRPHVSASRSDYRHVRKESSVSLH